MRIIKRTSRDRSGENGNHRETRAASSGVSSFGESSSSGSRDGVSGGGVSGGGVSGGGVSGGGVSGGGVSGSGVSGSGVSGSGVSGSGVSGGRGVGANGSRANGRSPSDRAAGERKGTGEHAELVTRLLARYRRSRSVNLRNQLIEHHRVSVEEMARMLRARLPRSVDVQDLIHAGMWGLIQAIENYRSELGPAFHPFMRIRVRGAMIDELRNMDYLPRLYRTRIRHRDEAVLRLRSTLDREPSDAELADDLGVSEAGLRQLSNLRPPVAQTFHAGADSDREELAEADFLGSLADHDQEAPIETINRRELMELIESTLQPIEWDVLRMHYLEGMSGKDVARELHLSASRICQIHGRVLSRLKMRLSRNGAG